MSAFIVPHKHINAIVKWAGLHNFESVPGNEQATAELFLFENTRSVNYRYNKTTPVDAIVFDFDAPDLTPIELIKACNCLDYQSCETEDWSSTPACLLLARIKDYAVRKLPGYEEADWEVV